jgi:hypothetical protein
MVKRMCLNLKNNILFYFFCSDSGLEIDLQLKEYILFSTKGSFGS